MDYKKAREYLKLSAGYIASVLGISENRLMEIESGACAPTMGEQEALRRLYGALPEAGGTGSILLKGVSEADRKAVEALVRLQRKLNGKQA